MTAYASFHGANPSQATASQLNAVGKRNWNVAVRDERAETAPGIVGLGRDINDRDIFPFTLGNLCIPGSEKSIHGTGMAWISITPSIG